MRLLDVLNSPWAIVPDRYVQVRDIYLRHLGGEKISEDTIKAIEASIGRPLENPEQGYEVMNGAALIPVDGVIAGRMNLFSRISGGCSIELLAQDFRQAMTDPAVNKIIFTHDSPGGVVAGIQDFAAEIFAARGKKPILAWTGNQMCSASYWLASACDGLYISNDTTQVGSIGVITSHVDVSKQEQMLGVKTTPIFAGAYKALANKYEPLSDKGKESIQSVVDYLYSVFVGDVAKHRGVSEDKALAMADGKVYIGKQALTAGLVDGVCTLEDLIAGAIKKQSISVPARAAGTDLDHSARAAENSEEAIMNVADLKAKHPDLYKAVYDAGYKAAEETVECPEEKQEEERKEGATAERARIQGVFAQSMAGHEALINALAFDGKTTGPEAAVQVLAAEKTKKGAVLGSLRADAPAVVPSPAAPVLETSAAVEDKSLPVEERAKAAWDKDAATRTEFGGSYASFLAYYKANDDGRVKYRKKS